MTSTLDKTGTPANRAVLELIPPEELHRVLSQIHADIDLEFVGFMEQYQALAKLIPRHFTVVDLGCAYNPQSYFFTEHKAYLAVDAPMPSEYGSLQRFCPANCTIFEMTISDFLDKHITSLDLDETFAICNYVPPWHGHNGKQVGTAFKNVFCFYPSDKQGRAHTGFINAMKDKGLVPQC